MGIHSGKFGVLNGISTVRNWSINEVAGQHNIVASNTKGGTLRRPGIQDWSGSFLIGGYAPTVMPGETFAFGGLTAPATDAEGGTGFAYTGQAIVDSVAIVWDWATGAPIAQTISFSGDGALTRTTASYTDTSDPDLPMSDNATKVEVVDGGGGSGGSADDELCGLKQATLTITAANQTVVNSCTGGWTQRKAGVIDWTLTLDFDEADPTNLPYEPKDYVELKLYIDDTDYWHLKWGLVGDISNLSVDRESGAIVGFTSNIAMASHDETPTEGLIQLPGAVSAWWPAA